MSDGDNSCYLAIDQGGHASRAFLYTANGKLAGAASVAINTYHPAPDRVEHDPEEMMASIRTAISGALRDTESHDVAAAGLATQRSSIICWDKTDGTALSPVISWQDRRTADALRRLEPQAAQIRRHTGLPLSPHYGASKLRWCLDHLPTVQIALKEGRLAWGPLASFLVFRLTEEQSLCADPANASRTLLWNLDSSDWDPALASIFGLPIDALPPCVPTRHTYGQIKNGNRRIPLALVTGDQSAALFASAKNVSGGVMINLGTGAFLQRALDTRPPSSRLLTSVAYEDADARIYALEGTVNGAGSALSWFAQQFGMDMAEINQRLPNWLQEYAHPPLFLNGVAGLGTPYLIPRFASHFIGEGSPAEKCVAVIESIVFLLQVNLQEMAGITGLITGITLSGGLSQLDGLCQRLADLSDIPLFRSAVHEAGVQGLLRLLTREDKWDSKPPTGHDFLPRANPPLKTRYRDWLRILEAAADEPRK